MFSADGVVTVVAAAAADLGMGTSVDIDARGGSVDSPSADSGGGVTKVAVGLAWTLAAMVGVAAGGGLMLTAAGEARRGVALEGMPAVEETVAGSVAEVAGWLGLKG